jgi:hypothetical protein
MKAYACLAALLALPATASPIAVPPGESAPALPVPVVQEDSWEGPLPELRYTSLMQLREKNTEGPIGAGEASSLAMAAAKPAAVAEPGVALLLATGWAALAWVRRRRAAS